MLRLSGFFYGHQQTTEFLLAKRDMVAEYFGITFTEVCGHRARSPHGKDLD